MERAEAEALLRHAGLFIPMRLAARVCSPVVTRNVVSAWEYTGKLRARTGASGLEVWVPDLAYCIIEHLAGRSIAPVSERDGLPGGPRGREYETPTSDDTSAGRVDLLDAIFSEEESRVLRLEKEVQGLRDSFKSLESLLTYQTGRALPITSKTELVMLLRAAQADLGKRSVNLSAIEGWARTFAGLGAEELQDIYAVGCEEPAFAKQAPPGLGILLALGTKLMTQVKETPEAYVSGTSAFTVRRKLVPVFQEMESKVIALAHARRFLSSRSGKMPAGSHAFDIFLLEKLR